MAINCRLNRGQRPATSLIHPDTKTKKSIRTISLPPAALEAVDVTPPGFLFTPIIQQHLGHESIQTTVGVYGAPRPTKCTGRGGCDRFGIELTGREAIQSGAGGGNRSRTSSLEAGSSNELMYRCIDNLSRHVQTSLTQ